MNPKRRFHKPAGFTGAARASRACCLLGERVALPPGSLIFDSLRAGHPREEISGLLRPRWRPNAWCFDIGANIGLMSAPCSRPSRPRVVSVEASPRTAGYLARTIAASAHRDRWQLRGQGRSAPPEGYEGIHGGASTPLARLELEKRGVVAFGRADRLGPRAQPVSDAALAGNGRARYPAASAGDGRPTRTPEGRLGSGGRGRTLSPICCAMSKHHASRPQRGPAGRRRCSPSEDCHSARRGEGRK